ncbi:MAG: FHA domain-containing protein [Spirochaetaceae bacterium]|nr:MAG: FHA domain-containing protein [Spirochaetaceae bacterium]
MPSKKTKKTGRNVSTVVNQDHRRPASSGILNRRGVLVILSHNKFGRAYVLKKPVTTIGRSDKCDIVLEDPMLSRVHCTITVDETGLFYIEDKSPTNPSFINSHEVKKKSMIHYADRIVTGETIFRFFLEEAVEKE